MNVPLITELMIPQNMGFSGDAVPKRRASAMLRLFADMIEKEVEGDVEIKLQVNYMDLPNFKVLRYSLF